jgi:hypothetical protein
MIISRNSFFLALLLIIVTPFLTHKIIWLARSKATTGTMGFTGKTYAGQIVKVYSVISFVAGNDTVWFNGNDNVLYKEGEAVPVRYQRDHPTDARINIFGSVWGDTVVYAGIPVMMLLIIFIHPSIIPRKACIRFNKRKPFVQVV